MSTLIPGVLQSTAHCQPNLPLPCISLPAGFGLAGGSPHFFPLQESFCFCQLSFSSSQLLVLQLLGNQDHIKEEIEKLKQTYDSQQQKLEEKV